MKTHLPPSSKLSAGYSNDRKSYVRSIIFVCVCVYIILNIEIGNSRR